MSTATLPAPPTRAAGRGSDFANLSRLIADAGLMKRRPGYYLTRIGLTAGCYLAGWAAFIAIGDSWWQLLTAAYLAVAFAQTALVAHDIAHRQVFRTRRASEIAGIVAGNLGIGMSYGWWMDKHTRHHANPNHEDRDPDVNPDLLVWSANQARSATGIARWFGPFQAYLFFPLLTLEGLNLHINSVRALSRPALRNRRAETAMLLLHFAAYGAVVLLVLSPGKAAAFTAIQLALFGVYLGSTFAPNHKGMEMLTSDDQQLDYLRRQVLTSRNVRGGHLLNAALGGLNYQIEHHLFPSMPSVNLRRAKPIIQAFCADIQVPYTETGLIDSYRLALRSLHNAGAPLRRKTGT